MLDYNKSQILHLIYLDLLNTKRSRQEMLLKYDIPERTFRRYLKDLKDLGYIVKRELRKHTTVLNGKLESSDSYYTLEDNMGVALALLCRQGTKLDVPEPLWEVSGSNLKLASGSLMKTGAWVVSESKAKDLVGRDLILCNNKGAPAYSGGKVLDYVFTKDEKGNPRTTFIFKLNQDLVGTEVYSWPEQNPVHYM